VPERPIVIGEFVALLTMLMPAPVTLPADVGANVTFRVADCPGVSTAPFEMPLALNPAPVTVTLEIVMSEFPLFMTAVGRELAPPSLTLPKVKLGGLALRDKVTVAPVPDRLITRGDGVPLVTRVILPLAGVAEVGVKTASKVVLPPAATVVDVESPVWLNSVLPETTICEKVSVALPLFRSKIG